jgi:hypothetical protein
VIAVTHPHVLGDNVEGVMNEADAAGFEAIFNGIVGTP